MTLTSAMFPGHPTEIRQLQLEDAYNEQLQCTSDKIFTDLKKK
jgi:hypothetical protein